MKKTHGEYTLEFWKYKIKELIDCLNDLTQGLEKSINAQCVLKKLENKDMNEHIKLYQYYVGKHQKIMDILYAREDNGYERN